jgi:hypothetical protein
MRLGSPREANRRDERVIVVVAVVVVVGLVLAFRLLPSDASPGSPLGTPLKGVATLDGKPVAGAQVLLNLNSNTEAEIGEKRRVPTIDQTKTDALGNFTLHLPVSPQLVSEAQDNGGFVNLNVVVLHHAMVDGAPRPAMGFWAVPAELHLGAIPPWTFERDRLRIELELQPLNQNPARRN